MSVTILDHALIQHKLTIMRDKNTSTYIFKQNLDEIAKLMAFEVTRNVSLKDKEIETPVCPMVGKEMDQQIILAPILRAGIGLEMVLEILFQQLKLDILEWKEMKKL